MCWGYSFDPVMYMCVGDSVKPGDSDPVMYMCVGGIVSPLSCICVLGV